MVRIPECVHAILEATTPAFQQWAATAEPCAHIAWWKSGRDQKVERGSLKNAQAKAKDPISTRRMNAGKAVSKGR